MCEKPMAINAVEAEKMVEAAKRNHRKLTIAYQGRFRREAQLLKQMCENEELGDVYFARAHEQTLCKGSASERIRGAAEQRTL